MTEEGALAAPRSGGEGEREARPLRIGALGAARITPKALIRPARAIEGVEVVAVAARDVARAQRFADRHGIQRVHRSYEALLGDPEIDALYNALPNGLHCEWTVRALEAGKHVLCEKPIASNADEAQRMADAATAHDRVLVEAFHWRYHDLAKRAVEIVRSGELGAIRRVEASSCFPIPLPGDIRYRYELGGGALMDAGCYAVSVVRHLSGEEPEVLRASAKLASPRVDRYLEGELRFPSGALGRVRASLFSARVLDVSARVEGERGELEILNPLMPQIYHRLRVRTPEGTRSERLGGEDTYTMQLRAFAGSVDTRAGSLTDALDGLANMRVIDALYQRAGLPRRGE